MGPDIYEKRGMVLLGRLAAALLAGAGLRSVLTAFGLL
jgi:hypothetical protein